MPRVLLLSPVAGRDPASGDITYTEVLAANPPAGVTYTTYDDALAEGSLRVRGRRPRHGGLAAADLPVLAARIAGKALRDRLLFREPVWFATVDTDAFDLVHQHTMALRQVGQRVPSISSAGYPLRVLYADRDGWSQARVQRAERLELLAARALSSHVPGVWAPRGSLVTTYTEHYATDTVARGVPCTQVQVLGQALPGATEPRTVRQDAFTIGFVGRDFRRKGGDLAVEAFRRVRAIAPTARLIVATVAGADVRAIQDADVEVHLDLDREGVATTVLDRIDVLVLPSRSDCGVPYGVLEALGRGIPVVAAGNPWLSPTLTAPACQVTPPTAGAVAAALLRLVDLQAWTEAAAAATALSGGALGWAAFTQDLRRAYDRVLAAAA